MQRRFSVVQGGLSGGRVRSDRSDPSRALDWRIVLHRPGAIGDLDRQAWRNLARSLPHPDPFADPDFLVTAAQHRQRSGEVVFALGEAIGEDDGSVLGGVLPLTLPHTLWGGALARSWHPALAPSRIEPICQAGAAPAFIEAVLRQLITVHPRIGLRLDGLTSEGSLLDALSGDPRLSVARHAGSSTIPAADIIDVSAAPAVTASRTVRVSSAAKVRDAVERYLLLDANRSRNPLLRDCGASAALRVTTRLFARRGEVEIALGYRDDEIVSGAISLGMPDARVVWRSVGLPAAADPSPVTTDVTISLGDAALSQIRPARLSLVGG